jgi:AraC-like DNA-binding protein
LNAGAGSEWTDYRRAPDRPIEVMRAHFVGHRYDRHAHDTYAFGVTEQGVQVFRCRGGSHASAAGMIMAFNPGEAHDGQAGGPLGFTYGMVHVGPALVAEILDGAGMARAGLPLFTSPVLHDQALAERLRRAHGELLAVTSRLEADETLAGIVLDLVGRHGGPGRTPSPARPDGALAAVAELLHDRLADDVSSEELAEVAGRSRFQLSRAFSAAYGLPPGAYQRQLRLDAARRRLAAGERAAGVAAATGFADQAHLTRWFRRVYGITPGRWQRSVVAVGR